MGLRRCCAREMEAARSTEDGAVWPCAALLLLRVSKRLGGIQGEAVN